MGEAAGQIGTRSVLFTDLVGSTELRVRVGEEAADRLRRAHDALIAEAVTAHGGVVVKGLGDGVMATFESAADGVGASVSIQQAVHRYGRRHPKEAFSVRVGLSTGDVSTEDGDVFGVPVVEASRLCGAATGGEILIAELVRALARGRGGFAFEPMGDLELKGLAEPLPACRVLWEPVLESRTDQAGEQVPLAGSLIGTTSTSYVGREALRDRLVAAWNEVRAGRCRTLLLAGEPGVGKTRTAAELARSAFADGGLVLFGRCDEDLGVPYQPFVEALAHHVAHAEYPALGAHAGELRRLVPDLGASVPDEVQPVASDPASEEHRLFQATSSWLVESAQANGVGAVLVLDDIHWATKPTLQLLQHVVRGATDGGAPLLVVATYRDTDIDRRHPLAAAIGDLRRLPGVDRLAVENLTSGEVMGFIEAVAGHELDAATRRLAEVVHSETEGNPFFVGEVLRHLVETGGVRRDGDRWVVADPDHVIVPEGVRDVVGRRLTRLTPTANEVLSVAAVIGRDFDVSVLLALVDAGEGAALDALDEAVRARLVEEVGVDQCRFAHALVRTTLYDELSATRRRRLHRRVADALEKARPDDVRALAYHCTEGGPEGGDVSRALRYTLAAAEEALAARAFADAEARFRSALELVEDADEARPTAWVTAMCGLGESLRDQGDPGFRQILLEAARRALELDDTPLAARAVLAGTRGFAAIIGGVDAERVAVIEEVLEGIGPGPTRERALLLGQLADEVTFTGDHARRLALVDEALHTARALDDPTVLAKVIASIGYAGQAGERAHSLVPLSEEGVRLADAAGDPTARIVARIFGSGALITVGRLTESDRWAQEVSAIAEADGTPLMRWIAIPTSMRLAVLDGDLDEAQARADSMLHHGLELGQSDGDEWWGAAVTGLLSLRGTAATLADLAGEMAERYPLASVWTCGRAWLLAEGGRHDEARAVLAASPQDPKVLVNDPFPFVALAQVAQCAYYLDDQPLGREVGAALEPYRDMWAHYFLFVVGPVTWPLGLCHAAAGDLDRAVEELEETERRLLEHDLSAYLPRLRLHLAEVLLRRDGRSSDRAAALLEAARVGGLEIEAPGVVSAVDSLLAG